MQDPILTDFPEEIRTPNLYMRLARTGDGPVLHEAMVELLRHNAPSTPIASAMELPTVEGIERACREAEGQWILRERFLLLNFDNTSGALTGSVGLQNMQWDSGRFDLSLWERPSWQGKGRLIEALTALFEHAFLHLNARRISCVIPSGAISLALMLEVAGMRQEAKLNAFSPAGDALQYAIAHAGGTRSSGV